MQETTADVTSDLENAIQKLKEYSRQQAEERRISPLQKTITLFRSLILDIKLPQKNSIVDRNEILQAIETVNRERLRIQKLKSGNPAERKLADSLTKAIETYNTCHENHIRKIPNQNKSLSNFFSNNTYPRRAFELPKIDLPQQFTVEYHYPDKTVSEKHKHKISNLKSQIPSSIHLSKQSSEMFQMKALALLERYGIASNSEARSSVKSSPILTAIDLNDSKCILAQTLSLFPGQTIVVMGSSELNLKTQSICKLFPETFSISLESTQTGFPHPSQRTGWALSNQLLPEYPQRIDLLQNLASVFQRKKQAMIDLLPSGNLISKAKKLLKLKKQAFGMHKIELLELHKKLALIILQTAPRADQNDEAVAIVSLYFDELARHHSPFEAFSEANQSIRDTFIAKPHQLLLDAALKGNFSDLGVDCSSVAYNAANQLLGNGFEDALHEYKILYQKASTEYEKRKLDYICCLGKVLGMAARQIILQYMSEDLFFEPPELTPFQKKIQAAAYMHVEEFLKELDFEFDADQTNNQNHIYLGLKAKILSDIDQFIGKNSLALPNELAAYYAQRHRSRLK